MNTRILSLLAAPLFLGACDGIDLVSDKVKVLKEARKESTEGTEGIDLEAITEGMSQTGPAVRDLAETEYQAFIAEPGRLNIVDFYADWCPPCRSLAPTLTGIVEANPGTVRLGKINVDRANALSREQGVTSIPDVRFYVDGKLVHKFVGAPSKVELERLIAKHSASIKPAEGGATPPAAGQPPAVTPPARPSNKKSIEEAMKPMEKNWMPPGLSPKK